MCIRDSFRCEVSEEFQHPALVYGKNLLCLNDGWYGAVYYTHLTEMTNYTLAKGRNLQYMDRKDDKQVCVIGDYINRTAFGGNGMGKTIKLEMCIRDRCYGANDVMEGVAIMKKEDVQCSITGNSTNPVRFQHLVAGTYKKWAIENGKKYFSVASGGGTGRTLHPDNVAAGPASYGLTDSLGRVHGDAQFAGSSSVPAHVEMMGLIGMGNNPMVGATVACAVAAAQANA